MHIIIHLLNILLGEWNVTGPRGTRHLQLQWRSVCHIPTASFNTDLSNILQFLCNFFLMMLCLHYSQICHSTFIFLLFFLWTFLISFFFASLILMMSVCILVHLFGIPFHSGMLLKYCCNLLCVLSTTNTEFFARLAALEPYPVLNVQGLI